jgi:preprotein translocase subunit SecD
VRALGRLLLLGLVLFLTSGCDAIARLLVPAPPAAENCVRGDYQVQATDEQAVTPEALEQTRRIIENRLNSIGLAAFTVIAEAPDRIVVTVAGPGDEAQILHLIGVAGVVLFVPVPAEFANAIIEGQAPPAGMPVAPIFAGDQIASARVGQTQAALPAVDIGLKEEGARLFDQYAAAHQGERFAIVLDGIVQSAPTINAPRFNGQAQISGNFTIAEVNDLVTVLRFGPLPLPILEAGFALADCANAGL